MKKIIFFLFLVPIISRAQNCISSSEPKTGKIIEAGVTFLKDTIKNTGGAIVFSEDGDEAYMQFANIFNSKTSTNRANKLLLMVKFKNGEIKKFTGNTDTRITSLLDQDQVSINFVCNLTQDDIVYFKKNPAIDFKISDQDDGSKTYDTEITGITADNIVKSIACIVK